MRFNHSGPHDGDIPPEAYQLADHLDAALAAAEDLAGAGRQWVPATASASYELAAQRAAERQVIEAVRTFETVLIGRVLKARKRAQVLARTAGDFAGITRLFVGGTAPLLDAVEELGDSMRADFETGACPIAYLRRRGVIADDAADLPEDRTIALGEDGFLVAGRIALAPLREMIITFLDALDLHYNLYPDEPDGSDPFSWSENTATAGSDKTLIHECAQSDEAADTMTFMSSAAREAAKATAQNAYDYKSITTDAGDAAQTGNGTPSRVHSPLAKVKANSLVDRLEAVARALE